MSRKQVILVVAVCSTFVVACLVGGYFLVSWLTLRRLDSARRDEAQAQCKYLAEAVRMYIIDARNNPAGVAPTSWDEILDDPMLRLNPEALKDPWGARYHLTVPSQHHNKDGFDVWSDCGGGGEPVGNW